MSDNNNLSFITGALIGSVVGAGLALVFAPKTGRELRSDINRGTRQAMDKADDLRVTVQEKGSEYMDQARIKGSELKEKSSEMTKQVTEKSKDVAQDVKDKSQQVADKAKKVADKAKDFTEDKKEEIEETVKNIKEEVEDATGNIKEELNKDE